MVFLAIRSSVGGVVVVIAAIGVDGAGNDSVVTVSVIVVNGDVGILVVGVVNVLVVIMVGMIQYVKARLAKAH